MPFYLTPEQDDFNQLPELQICIAEALYDVDSIVLIQKPTPKKTSRPYTARLCRIWNRRGRMATNKARLSIISYLLRKSRRSIGVSKCLATSTAFAINVLE